MSETSPKYAYRFEAPELEPEAREAIIREMIAGGEAVPRHEATQQLGKDRAVAWWDHFGPIATEQRAGLADIGKSLKPDEVVRCARDDIPQAVWDRHRLKYSNPDRHGLSLTDEPVACLVLGYPDGGVGLMIGYAKA